MKCPICGNEIPDKIKYCPVCGGSTRSRHGNIVLYVAIGVTMFLLIVVIAVFLMSGHTESGKFSEKIENFETYCAEYQLGDMELEYHRLMEDAETVKDQKETKRYEELEERFQDFEERLQEQVQELETYEETADEYEEKFQHIALSEEAKQKADDLIANLQRVKEAGSLSRTKKTAERLQEFYEECIGEFQSEDLEIHETQPEESQPASQADTEDRIPAGDDLEMIRQYQQIVQQVQSETDEDECSELANWEIVDLNGDGIKELYVETSWNNTHGHIQLWKWKNNRAVQVDSSFDGNFQSRDGIYLADYNGGYSSGDSVEYYKLNSEGELEHVFGWDWTKGAYNGLGRDVIYEMGENRNHVKEISEAYIEQKKAELGIKY